MTGSKLRWRCRRGTRELDIILQRFLDDGYAALSEADRGAFEALLDEQDPELAAWILAGDPPPERWRAVIEKIRATTRHPLPLWGRGPG